MANLVVPVDRVHRFVVQRTRYVRILPKRPDGEGFADCAYEFSVGKRSAKGTVAADGIIVEPVARTARKADLRVWEQGATDAAPHEWAIRLGKLPPLGSVAGVQRRLENFGFDCGTEDGEEGPLTRAAVRAFEEWLGLRSALEEFRTTGEVTRESPISDAVRAALDALCKRPAGLHHGGDLEDNHDRDKADL